MGLNLSLQREVHSPEDNKTWLGSAHGTDTADSVTLLSSAFTTTFGTDTDHDGVVPSGVVVRENADGLFVPYADGVADARAGILLEAVQLDADGGNVGGALLWHAQVLIANLPDDHGLTESGAADLPLVHFIGDVPADPS